MLAKVGSQRGSCQGRWPSKGPARKCLQRAAGWGTSPRGRPKTSRPTLAQGALETRWALSQTPDGGARAFAAKQGDPGGTKRYRGADVRRPCRGVFVVVATLRKTCRQQGYKPKRFRIGDRKRLTAVPLRVGAAVRVRTVLSPLRAARGELRESRAQ